MDMKNYIRFIRSTLILELRIRMTQNSHSIIVFIILNYLHIYFRVSLKNDLGK